jgi:hypothetical protein
VAHVNGDADRGAGTSEEPNAAGLPDHAHLHPAQQEVLDLLGAPADSRPTFDASLRDDLRGELENALAHLGPDLHPDDPLWVSKHALSSVHGCEVRLLAEREVDFEWSVPLARGTVSHKAIELSVHWKGAPTPSELVDESIGRLTNGGDGLAEFLQRCTEADVVELRGECLDRVTKFLESFPPLQARWRPVTESRARVELVGGRIILSGKVDMSLGQARGTTAGKVLIDLKTGGFTPSHLDDLRFYALLETMRLGVPPRLVAGYYLDAGQARAEAVSEASLRATVARVSDGVERLVGLTHGTVEPVLRTGPACRWCPRLSECDAGREHLSLSGWERSADDDA